MMSIDEYNNNLRLQDAARARRAAQPSGLAAYAARKREQEAAALAPFTLEKDGYGWTIRNAAGIICNRCIKTKKEAIAWIDQEKAAAQRPETISTPETETKKEEANTMENTFTFTAETITCKGKTFPAEYSISPAGAVTVFVKMSESSDEKTRVRFNLDHPAHAAAHAAALEQREKAAAARAAEQEKPAAAPVETPATAPVETPAAPVETARPETISTDETPAPARPDRAPLDKPARGPVPEKTFIGQAITGTGWKILFDGETARTRVIFESNPTDAARAALDKAGFFFSAGMNSWNKKLTFKAYRAAQALAAELSALYPAAAA